MNHLRTACDQECYEHNSACVLRADNVRRALGDAFPIPPVEYDSAEFHALGFTWEGPCRCVKVSFPNTLDTEFDPDDLPTSEQGEYDDK